MKKYLKEKKKLRNSNYQNILNLNLDSQNTFSIPLIVSPTPGKSSKNMRKSHFQKKIEDELNHSSELHTMATGREEEEESKKFHEEPRFRQFSSIFKTYQFAKKPFQFTKNEKKENAKVLSSRRNRDKDEEKSKKKSSKSRKRVKSGLRFYDIGGHSIFSTMKSIRPTPQQTEIPSKMVKIENKPMIDNLLVNEPETGKVFFTNKVKSKIKTFEEFGLENPFYTGELKKSRFSNYENFSMSLRESNVSTTKLGKKKHKKNSKSVKKKKKINKKGRKSLDVGVKVDALFKFTVDIPEVELGTEVKIDISGFEKKRHSDQLGGAFKKHFENLNRDVNEEK